MESARVDCSARTFGHLDMARHVVFISILLILFVIIPSCATRVSIYFDLYRMVASVAVILCDCCAIVASTLYASKSIVQTNANV